MQPGLHDKELFVFNMTANVKYRLLIVQVGHNEIGNRDNEENENFLPPKLSYARSKKRACGLRYEI